MSLDSLIQDCKRYKPKAQKELYEKYASFFKGICYRYIKDDETVKDIVHDSFIKIFSSIRQYKGTGSFEGWMVRILINLTVSHLRKSKKVLFHNIENINESVLFQNNSDSESGDDGVGLSKKDEAEMIKSSEFTEKDLLKILDSIPDKYKVVFNLHCVEKYSHSEIAKILEIDVATSRVRLMRARQMIKKELFSLSLIKSDNANE